MMSKLKLTVNETKTRVCSLPEEKFDFLGYTFGRCYSTRTGRAYLGTVPSKKRVQRICRAVSEEPERRTTQLDSKTLVGKLNRMMTGWANYFCRGPVSKAYDAVDRHAKKRLRQWLCTKHKVPWPSQELSGGISVRRVRTGLLSQADQQLSAGESVSLFREPDAVAPHVRFDEREQETEPSQTGLRRPSEGKAN
jgi:hypothetical protein